jgi:hypothetical protein
MRLVKIIVAKLVKKFRVFYGSRWFITVFTNLRQCKFMVRFNDVLPSVPWFSKWSQLQLKFYMCFSSPLRVLIIIIIIISHHHFPQSVTIFIFYLTKLIFVVSEMEMPCPYPS